MHGAAGRNLPQPLALKFIERAADGDLRNDPLHLRGTFLGLMPSKLIFCFHPIYGDPFVLGVHPKGDQRAGGKASQQEFVGGRGSVGPANAGGFVGKPLMPLVADLNPVSATKCGCD